ncbi:MAG: TOBE domain-containing protein, partial [Rhodobacteraceae bacterium]|nr:TOBE domain-containing protein [Paracoccaceae bacterium]
LFVAGFIGSPSMSFLDGHVTTQDGAPAFRCGELSVPLAGYDGEVPAADGRRGILGIRPEHVSIDATGAEGLPATVDIDEPMGSDSLVWLNMDGQTVSARTAPGHGLSPGQRVGLGFDISKASLFDRDSEQRF